MAGDSKPSRALDGVKILAFEQVLSGPFATCLLADMGAEVIKVERPGVGDVIRSWDSVVKGLSSGYVWLNRNKRSLTVDVKKEKGREILQKLAKRSDIFFENYAPGVAGRLGLGYEKLSELNPRLIYCSLSGYGQDGPYRDVKAYDLTDSRRRRHHRHHRLSRQARTRGHRDRRHRFRHVRGHRHSACALPARKNR